MIAPENPLQTAGVIGGGAWGTALAQSLRRAGRDVILWARDPVVVAAINQRHVNGGRLPDVSLDPGIRATADLAEAAGADFLLMAVPAQRMRHIVKALAAQAGQRRPVIVCAKGVEQGTHCAMTEVVAQVLQQHAAVLSGPSFALDLARGLPTAVTLAARTRATAELLAGAVGHRLFRIYTSDDVVGVEMGGAVKNVLAIAAGVLVGRGLGASAHAALVTRAFRELARLGEHLGARPETLTGLSCLGDLMLTCNSPQSRNFTLGRHLGEGMGLREALTATGGTVEGVATAGVIEALARQASPALDLPITFAVHGIVSGDRSVDVAIDQLLSRPPKSEG